MFEIQEVSCPNGISPLGGYIRRADRLHRDSSKEITAKYFLFQFSLKKISS
jgi:hypothetical protein